MDKLPFKFKAVIFDMDGVITDTMPYHFDAWLKALSEAGIKVNCYDVYKREGQDGMSTIKELSKERGMKFDYKQARKILTKKEDIFKRSVKRKFIKGSRPFLRYLKKRNFILGLVTGTSRKETEKIMPKSLLAIFKVVITASEVKRGKPDPEPFQKALDRLKLSSREALVIENAPFGIRAAKKAGLFCIALETSLPKKYLKDADVILKNFAHLRKFASFAPIKN